MRALTITEHISLDGVIQNSVDDDEFSYTGWNGAYRTAEGLERTAAPITKNPTTHEQS